MILTIIILIISFLFEGFISNYLNISFLDNNYFSTLYTLITLIILYTYFNNQKKYLILLIIFACVFDIVYTNTFILNIVLFLLVYYFNRFLDIYLPTNILTINIKTILSIFLYNFITFIIIIFTNYSDYLFSTLINITIKSIPLTIIYTTISYIIITKIYEKYDIKIK
jgi:hypothetical protein